MGIITFLLLVNDADKVRIRSVAAFSMIFLWFNVFNYLRAYRKGSALVKMLIEIMIDMGYFVCVVLVLLLSFAGGSALLFLFSSLLALHPSQFSSLLSSVFPIFPVPLLLSPRPLAPFCPPPASSTFSLSSFPLRRSRPAQAQVKAE